MKIDPHSPPPVAVIIGQPKWTPILFDAARRARLAPITRLAPGAVDPETWPSVAATLAGVEVIFGTWNLPAFSAADLEAMPHLRAVFYAAGTVRGFAEPMLARGIQVFSAAAANAIPVAEFTLAQILLANKDYFRDTRVFKSPDGARKDFGGCGNFGATVALLGAGAIGRLVIELLRPFHLKIVVFDPFLDAAGAERLGVEKVTLAEAFARGQVVSNHLANLPETREMLNGPLFQSMRPHATFINTGRGATVHEPEMIAVLGARPDLTALLDVTNPEPPVEGSPLYTLPNVQLTSHIAGSLGDECGRMADWMIDEFERWRAGEPTRHEVTAERLQHMA